METLTNIGLVILVILIFNFVIFFHELGHFLAAKWRGLKVDRFQIWFGKPIWSKTIGGVQYGLGWIPAGGFVSLPQLVTMESIEGSVEDGVKENLPKAKPWDKIIVAFAGPLFSFALAIVAALVVWGVGVPDNKLKTTTVGFIVEGADAEGKLKLGDKILEVEGVPVEYWAGSPPQKSVSFQIVVSEGDSVDFKLERDGEIMNVSTGFNIPETHFLQRKGHRKVGVWCERECIVGSVDKNSPAQIGGLEPGDLVTLVDGIKVWGPQHFYQLVKGKDSVELTYKRGEEEMKGVFALTKPKNYSKPEIGINWSNRDKFAKFADKIVYPDPVSQCANHVSLMWTTLTKIVSPNNDIGAQQLQSPLGIAGTYYDMLKTEHGWRLILSFTVLLNVNLAILNMLPLPVLDGGHITTSFYEIIMSKSLPAKLMGYVQGGFVILLLSFMFWIFTKDFFARWWWGDEPKGDIRPKELIFDPPGFEQKPASDTSTPATPKPQTDESP